MKSSLHGGGTGFSYKEVTLVGGEKVIAHHPAKCKGQVCCIHNPSRHHMRYWSQHWRNDRKLMERVCEHGIGHPDPDHFSRLPVDEQKWVGIHGCDGCCQPILAGDEAHRQKYYPSPSEEFEEEEVF